VQTACRAAPATQACPGAQPLPNLRWDGWRFAAAASLLSIGLCIFASFLLPGLLGLHQWLTTWDAWWTVEGARWVSHGAIGTVYSGDPMYLPLPGMLVLLAPLVALGDHLGLAGSYPIPIDYPSLWLLVGPAFFVFGSTAILGADYLAETIGVTGRRRRLIALATAVFVVPPACVWAGHPEDMLALAMSCLALALLLRGRTVGAALTLSIAIMMQPWAGLLVPLLVGATPPGDRKRVLVWALLLPASCAACLYALDPAGTYQALVMQPMLGNGQHLPWWGLGKPMTIHMGSMKLAARVGSGSRSVAVAVSCIVGWWVARDRSTARVVGGAALCLLARGIFETQLWSWYVAPAAVCLTLVAARSKTTKRWTIGALSAFALYALPAAAYGSYSMPSWLALLGLLVFGAAALWAPGGTRKDDRAANLHEADLQLSSTLDSLDGTVNYPKWILDLLEPYLGSRILEVGAGHGTMTRLLACDGRLVTATEASERCARHLAARFDGDARIHVHHGASVSLSELGSFDSAVLINVLEHIPDAEAALAELHDVLEPGGHIAIWAPAHQFLYSEFDRRVGHHRRYTSGLVARQLKAAGFELEEVRYANSLGALLWFVTARVLRRDPTRPSGVRLFDRYAVPLVRRIESRITPPFGQSVLAVATRTS
jgi:SAM-dependent methyltransferase